MNVNDDAYHLDERVVLALIAGNRASTGRSYKKRVSASNKPCSAAHNSTR